MPSPPPTNAASESHLVGKTGCFPLILSAFARTVTGRNGPFELRHVILQQQYVDRESGEKRFTSSLKPEHIPAAIALLQRYADEQSIRTIVDDNGSDHPAEPATVPAGEEFGKF